MNYKNRILNIAPKLKEIKYSDKSKFVDDIFDNFDDFL